MLTNILEFSLRFLQSKALCLGSCKVPLLAAIFLAPAGYLLGAVSPKHCYLYDYTPCLHALVDAHTRHQYRHLIRSLPHPNPSRYVHHFGIGKLVQLQNNILKGKCLVIVRLVKLYIISIVPD